jgi:hypothetical protein
MSKNSPERCTGALVSIIAHITPAEPRARLDSTEIANGFANRFLFVASRRSKLLSHGGNVPRNLVSEFGIGLAEVIRFAHNVSEVDMTDEAWLLWDARYARLTNRPPGLVGAITGRAGAIVRRLAMLYALLDGRPSVSPTPDDPSREP